jgi:hypothetical protein
MTIIFFAACRSSTKEKYEQLAKKDPALFYNGISIVIYSSESGKPT